MCEVLPGSIKMLARIRFTTMVCICVCQEGLSLVHILIVDEFEVLSTLQIAE